MYGLNTIEGAGVSTIVRLLFLFEYCHYRVRDQVTLTCRSRSSLPGKYCFLLSPSTSCIGTVSLALLVVDVISAEGPFDPWMVIFERGTQVGHKHLAPLLSSLNTSRHT
jgi:hypothetical protein